METKATLTHRTREYLRAYFQKYFINHSTFGRDIFAAATVEQCVFYDARDAQRVLFSVSAQDSVADSVSDASSLKLTWYNFADDEIVFPTDTAARTQLCVFSTLVNDVAVNKWLQRFFFQYQSELHKIQQTEQTCESILPK